MNGKLREIEKKIENVLEEYGTVGNFDLLKNGVFQVTFVARPQDSRDILKHFPVHFCNSARIGEKNTIQVLLDDVLL